jgi:hypothetical protein
VYYQLSNASDTLIFLPGLAGLDGPRVPVPTALVTCNGQLGPYRQLPRKMIQKKLEPVEFGTESRREKGNRR